MLLSRLAVALVVAAAASPLQAHPQERIVCSIAAAAKYEIPANVLLAVAEKENGRPGQWVRNRNGSHDVGTLQFNTSYLRTLSHYGISTADVAAPGCYAYDLAAWRLRNHILKDQGDLWTRAANYHSRTPKFNSRYRLDLMRRAARWADWLSARYATHEIAGAEEQGQRLDLGSSIEASKGRPVVQQRAGM
jgi:hypothetical protein